MEERFEKKFEGYWQSKSLPAEIRDFIRSEIALAIAQREEELRGKIEDKLKHREIVCPDFCELCQVLALLNSKKI